MRLTQGCRMITRLLAPRLAACGPQQNRRLPLVTTLGVASADGRLGPQFFTYRRKPVRVPLAHRGEQTMPAPFHASGRGATLGLGAAGGPWWGFEFDGGVVVWVGVRDHRYGLLVTFARYTPVPLAARWRPSNSATLDCTCCTVSLVGGWFRGRGLCRVACEQTVHGHKHRIDRRR